MPQIGTFHPQVVHFVIASLFVGMPIYWLGYIPRLRVLRLLALILLVVGAGAAWVAVESGEQAHEPVEDMPGARPAVEEHEEWGERTAILFSVLVGVQLLSFLVSRTADRRAAAAADVEVVYDPSDPDALPPGYVLHTMAKGLTLLVAVGWAGGLAAVYETAEHGGELVYGYAGGVGIRSGKPEDVQRLLLAGLYQESLLDRQAGAYGDAARLVDEMVRRYPTDPEVRLLLAESYIEDRKDGRGALRALESLAPQNVGRASLRKAVLTSDAYSLLALPDSAKMVLDALPEAQRRNGAVSDRLRRLSVP